MALSVGVPAETHDGERRVALVPAGVPTLVKEGLEVLVERGAGSASGFPDDQYTEKGARVLSSRQEIFAAAAVLLQVRGPGANPDHGKDDLELVRQGQVLIGQQEALSDPEAVQDLARRGATGFAMELLPRITRAQSMDVLSSQATVAGYRAVLLAATNLPKMFPMLMTAAGTLAPARVFVIGVGVAGLQAIATARRLGAMVEAYDIRPAVAEQVRSLGAKFVELEVTTDQAETSGGYARQQSEEFIRRQQQEMGRVIASSDVVITTAAVPGKRAPILVTAEMVAGMRPGSVVVDVAAERGGNCELSRPGQTVVEHGVTILAPANLPAAVPAHASQMYGRNVSAFLHHLLQDGLLALERDDEIIQSTLLCRNGEVVHPQVRERLGLEPREADRQEDTTETGG
jgi:NAD(P) transhydrogenase subunit alpha